MGGAFRRLRRASLKPQNVFQGCTPEGRNGWIVAWHYQTELGQFQEEQLPALFVVGGAPFTVAVEHYGLTHHEPTLRVLAMVQIENSRMMLPCSLNRIEMPK